jgi:hypothetical protein
LASTARIFPHAKRAPMKPIYKPCDVCGDAKARTRPIQSSEGPVLTCYPCATEFVRGMLAASDDGWDPEECERFGWIYVREQRGKPK